MSIIFNNNDICNYDNIDIDLKSNIKKMIKIKFAKISFEECRKVIDYCFYIIEKKLDLKKIIDKVILSDKSDMIEGYFVELCLKKKLINVPEISQGRCRSFNSKMNILNLYYDYSNDNFMLLYTVLTQLRSFTDILKIENLKNIAKCGSILTSSHTHNSDVFKSFDNLDTYNSYTHKCDTNNITKVSSKFLDIFKEGLLDYLDMKPVKMSDTVDNSTSIEFYEISDNTRKKIEQFIHLNIDNILVKKKFIPENYLSKEEKLILKKTNGLPSQYLREVTSLKKLFKKKHFPVILSKNDSESSVYMTYTGVSINEDNIPKDWKYQLDEIVNILTELNISHNDMWRNNFTVKNDIIYLVDFGWSDKSENYPFINISIDDIEKHHSLLDMIDSKFINFIHHRLKFLSNIT